MAPGEFVAAPMTHGEFVAAYTSGRIRVRVPPAPAAKFLSARMLLPWVLLPLLGASVAFALARAWVFALILFALALLLRGAVRVTAPGYILQRALSDPAFYAEVTDAHLLEIDSGAPPPAS